VGGTGVEILEALLLAIVAVATAWSGYQAARWDGRQAELYGEASTIRIDTDQQLTLGGQQRLLDVSTFNTWIEARNEGRTELAALYERRFSPEFKAAVDAWLATRPFANPDAPPGPSFMPE
jgi:predicted dehydrogenase